MKISKSIGYFFLGLVLSISITIIRYITGPEFDIDQFYLIPIIIVTWYAGRNAGIIISTISILLWIVFDYFTLQSLAMGLAPGLNQIFRLLIFILIIELIHKVKDSLVNLQEISETDPLTRISNRRSFMLAANRELERARRYGQKLTLIYIDLDNFKTINDTFGHSVGDQLLKEVATTLNNNTRKTDVVARMGGDEFCILLTEIGLDTSIKVYKKIAKNIALIMKENDWPVTMSSGIVSFEDKPENVKEMITMTDELMYKVKRSGKNSFGQKVYTK
jgi:diguanylate cyclase (GGDEF)-like protein